MNSLTLTEFYFSIIERANIKGLESNVAMNAWLPQASYSYGNFSGNSSLRIRGTKGLIDYTFMVYIHTIIKRIFSPLNLFRIYYQSSILIAFPLNRYLYFRMVRVSRERID